jgi:hypothetical protein
MADLTVAYVLTTPGGTITFNGGTLGSGSSTNLYWISALHGLDSPTIRFPNDDVAFGDGGVAHNAWRGPAHIVIDGDIIIQSVPFGGDCRAALNTMENNLATALSSCLYPNTATLAWTPTGMSAKTLTVVYEVALDVQPDTTFALRHFTFGLFSESPGYY